MSFSLDDVKSKSISVLFQELNSSEKGLSTSDVRKRLQKFGYNEIKERKESPLIRFLRYFWGPIPWMIEAAIILSAIIHHWEDLILITALLMLNGIIGFWHEYKADNAIVLLKKKLALKAQVLRDYKWREISARELVPGDIVRVRLGNIVPADIKLISHKEEDFLLIDESTLTGESMPVEKHSSDIAYSGSVVKQGEINALVITTGSKTFFGKTTQLVEEAETQSHFQKAIVKIGDYLITLAVGLVVLIFMISLFRNESLLETLRFALVLTVAAIPVALPAVMALTLAIGATVLAQKKAIISRLVAIEELAGIDILCTDKTGTITKNELAVASLNPFNNFSEDDILLFSCLASREEDQDPIDNAILSKVKERDTLEKKFKDYKIDSFKPFDPSSKKTEATVINSKGIKFKVAKGAPQVILSLAFNVEEIGKKVKDTVDAMASKGYRALGVAKTEGEEGWKFVGIIGLQDPPREDSADTIKTAQSMGVDIKMVTGDHIAIAKEISKQVGMGTNIFSAHSFEDKPDREAERIIEGSDGFAEVFPKHKYDIVKLLQGHGHIIGMTGDGVNDAPALKKADAGIAVASATDAARSAADIVLTTPGLSVIIDALKESRRIFQRMTNYSIYRIAETIRVLLFITASIIIFNFYPVSALMIVLLALLNDIPIITIAYDTVKYSDIPEKWNMRIILGTATYLGFIGLISSFGVLYLGEVVFHLNSEILQSFIYLKLSVAGHLTLFVARTKGPFWSVKPAPILFLTIVVTQTIATLIVVYGFLLPAIGWTLALIVWIYALVMFLITDRLKLFIYKLLDHKDITMLKMSNIIKNIH
ncbi:plasma-membrane proton-efflux P-type ATPase [[Eubacterium] cellulosolvens]